MTITDPRQPVFIKKGKRYVAFGSLDQGWDRFDSWYAEGLWLHERDEHTQRMRLIARLDELPCSAVSFAALQTNHQELVRLFADNERLSRHDMATVILEWIAKKSQPNENHRKE